MSAVPTDAAVVIFGSILAVEIVPGVRQIERGPGGIVETRGLGVWNILAYEAPVGIESDVGSMMFGRLVKNGAGVVRAKNRHENQEQPRDRRASCRNIFK